MKIKIYNDRWTDSKHVDEAEDTESAEEVE